MRFFLLSCATPTPKPKLAGQSQAISSDTSLIHCVCDSHFMQEEDEGEMTLKEPGRQKEKGRTRGSRSSMQSCIITCSRLKRENLWLLSILSRRVLNFCIRGAPLHDDRDDLNGLPLRSSFTGGATPIFRETNSACYRFNSPATWVAAFRLRG